MAYTEFYCRAADGSNLNAGSTNAAAAAFTYASGSWVASTGVFTVASGDPASDGVAVGDFASVYADGATVGVFVGRVTARDATTITVSLTVKSGTAPTDGTNTRTLKIGGAWKGPNGAEAFPFVFAAAAMINAAGDMLRVNLKNGTTYSITAVMAHNLPGPMRFEGFTTTAGDGGKAIIDGTIVGASYTLLATTSATYLELVNLIFQNNGTTGSADLVSLAGDNSTYDGLVASGSRGAGIVIVTARAALVECESFGNNLSNTASKPGFYIGFATSLIRCISHDNAGSNGDGFLLTINSHVVSLLSCISESNGGDGIKISGGSVITSVSLVGCELYSNAGDGVDMTSSSRNRLYAENCNFIKNGAWGINKSGSGGLNGMIRNCGFGAGTQANTSGTIATSIQAQEVGSVTYASDVTPWVDPANGDFRINLAAAKGAGRGNFTQTAASYAGAIAYPDIGAAQHLDAGGAAVFNPLESPIITSL